MAPRPVLTVSALVALSLLGDSALYAVLPSQYEAFGLPLIAVGLLLSANRYVRLLTNPAAGYLCDRVGIRWPFVGAIVLGGLTTEVYGLAPGVLVFVAARLLWGGCWSVLRLGGYLATLHYSPPARLASALGIYHAVSRLGTLAGMLAGGILADAVGPRFVFLLFGAITLLALPLSLVAGLDRIHAPRPAPARAPGKGVSPLGFLTGGYPGRAGWQLATVHLAALWTGLVAALVTSSLGLLLRVRFGERIDVLGLVLGVTALTGIVLSGRSMMDLAVAPLSGMLVDRLGRRPAAVAFALVAVAGLALLATASGLGLVLVGVLFAFISGSALVVVLDSAAGSLAPKAERAGAMSRYATWMDLGSASGPALGYTLLSVLGLPAMYALAALGLLALMGTFVWATPPAPEPTRRRAGG